MASRTGADPRSEALRDWSDWTERPLAVLGLAWLLLLIVELVDGLSPLLQAVTTAIWAVFLADFVVRLALAPARGRYLREHWLTAVALLVPALRVLRLTRVVAVARSARAARGVRLLRVVTSVNRGMRSLRVALATRRVAYAAALTAVVALAGAAGMYAFERDGPAAEGFDSYGEALWWTAMLLTTMGSEAWPATPEGRALCVILAVYAFAVFGYVTAVIAAFFLGKER